MTAISGLRGQAAAMLFAITCGTVMWTAGGPARAAAGGSASAASAATAGPGCTRSLYGSTSPAAGQSSAARPVILVHGWTGDPLTGTASALAARLGGQISTFTFNYAKWAADWPTNTNIAPCLAQYVADVSAAYKLAGGDGKVILVAHSMGGLAIRYASSPRYVAQPVTAAEAPLVITLDTPYLGSPWGGRLPYAKELLGGLLGKSVPNPFGTDGGSCLRTHDKGQPLPAQCGDLPPWLPGGTTLDEVGGDITIARTLFGIRLYDIDTSSDGIVGVRSSHGYLTSGPGGTAPYVSSPTTGTSVHSQWVDCTVTSDMVAGTLSELAGPGGTLAGIPVRELSDYAVLRDLQAGRDTPLTMAYQGAAMFVAPCGHIHVTTDPAAIAIVAKDISGYLVAHQVPTALVTEAPVDAAGQPRQGLAITDGGTAQCEAGSDSVGQAYRCFSAAGILDPCWLDGTDPAQASVLCQEHPWDTRLIRLRVTAGGLSPFLPPVTSIDYRHPWAVKLADGEQCTALQGTHSSVNGKVIDFSCGGSGPRYHYLLRTLDRSRPQWTYQSVYSSSSGGYQRGPQEAVVTAWYAGLDTGAAAAARANDCTATAIAYAAGAYEMAQGNSDTQLRVVNAQACDAGYAEMIFTASSPVSYTASFALKATASGWQVIGTSDYIQPGSFGMPASVGKAINQVLMASPQSEQVAF